MNLAAQIYLAWIRDSDLVTEQEWGVTAVQAIKAAYVFHRIDAARCESANKVVLEEPRPRIPMDHPGEGQE